MARCLTGHISTNASEGVLVEGGSQPCKALEAGLTVLAMRADKPLLGCQSLGECQRTKSCTWDSLGMPVTAAYSDARPGVL